MISNSSFSLIFPSTPLSFLSLISFIILSLHQPYVHPYNLPSHWLHCPLHPIFLIHNWKALTAAEAKHSFNYLTSMLRLCLLCTAQHTLNSCSEFSQYRELGLSEFEDGFGVQFVHLTSILSLLIGRGSHLSNPYFVCAQRLCVMVSAAYCTLLLFPPSKHGSLVAYRHMCDATVVKVSSYFDCL